LIHQLKNGGKMVAPAGLPDAQQLVLVDKDGNGRVTMREVVALSSSLRFVDAPEHCRHGGARIPSRQQANVQLVSALGAGRLVVFYGGP
jgi:hypothetical protein